MESIQNFFTSLTVTQIALALGGLTFLAHSLLDHFKGLSKPLNFFIVRFTTLVIPVLTALATDPNIAGLIHAYFPALLGFFTAYQGLYQGTKALHEKLEALKSIAAPVETQTV